MSRTTASPLFELTPSRRHPTDWKVPFPFEVAPSHTHFTALTESVQRVG